MNTVRCGRTLRPMHRPVPFEYHRFSLGTVTQILVVTAAVVIVVSRVLDFIRV